MINFAYWLFGGGIGYTILNYVHSATASKPEVFSIMTGIAFVIFTVWFGVIINEIQQAIKAQLLNFYSLETLKKEKISYEEQMEAYKREMKPELLEKYKKFEETLMSHIKDSKIIAMLLEKSGYSDLLKRYDSAISVYLSKMYGCDRQTDQAIRDMKIQQSDPIYGYSTFLPKRALYMEDKP